VAPHQSTRGGRGTAKENRSHAQKIPKRKGKRETATTGLRGTMGSEGAHATSRPIHLERAKYTLHLNGHGQDGGLFKSGEKERGTGEGKQACDRGMSKLEIVKRRVKKEEMAASKQTE